MTLRPGASPGTRSRPRSGLTSSTKPSSKCAVPGRASRMTRSTCIATGTACPSSSGRRCSTATRCAGPRSWWTSRPGSAASRNEPNCWRESRRPAWRPTPPRTSSPCCWMPAAWWPRPGASRNCGTRLAQLMVPTLADSCAMLLLTDQGMLRAASVVHRDPAKAAILARPAGHRHPAGRPAAARGPYPGHHPARHRRQRHDARRDPRGAGGNGHPAACPPRERGRHALAHRPASGRGRGAGARRWPSPLHRDRRGRYRGA